MSTQSTSVSQEAAPNTTIAGPSVALRPRPAQSSADAGAGLSAKAAAKKSIWEVDQTAPVDVALLAASAPCRPFDSATLNGSASAERRPKRACANCVCGLAEVQAAERAGQSTTSEQASAASKEGMEGESLSGSAAGPAVRKYKTVEEAQAALANKASACNGCSLGDAFRCADCPARGLSIDRNSLPKNLILSQDCLLSSRGISYSSIWMMTYDHLMVTQGRMGLWSWVSDVMMIVAGLPF